MKKSLLVVFTVILSLLFVTTYGFTNLDENTADFITESDEQNVEIAQTELVTMFQEADGDQNQHYTDYK